MHLTVTRGEERRQRSEEETGGELVRQGKQGREKREEEHKRGREGEC